MIYVGNYLRIWIPQEKKESIYKVCPSCDFSAHSPFCPACGTKMNPLMEDTNAFHMYELLEDVFGNGDKFCVSWLQGDYAIITTNSEEQSGGQWHDECDIEFPIDEKVGFFGEWLILEDALIERGARFERVRGIVVEE